MTSRDFVYWLQGYFEINSNQPRPMEYAETLNSEQIEVIKNHLAMVFHHEIDPSFGKDKEALDNLHQSIILSQKSLEEIAKEGSIKVNC